MLVVAALLPVAVSLSFRRTMIGPTLSFAVIADAAIDAAGLAALAWSIAFAVAPLRISLRRMVLAAAALPLTFVLAVELTLADRLGLGLWQAWIYLPAPRVSVFALLDIARHYAVPAILAFAAGGTAVLLLAIDRFAAGNAASPSLAAALPVSAAVVLLVVGLAGTTAPAASAQAMTLASIPPHLPVGALHAVDRRAAIRLDGEPRLRPKTIVLVVNESTGGTFRGARPNRTPLTDRLMEIGGPTSAWLNYRNAYANSSCTDVSLPSLFTGSGPHEGLDKLHRLPFLFDIAAARGYETAYVTSQVLEWAGLRTFLSTAAIDLLVSARETGRPLINDLGVDDEATVEPLRRFVEERPGKDLFIVLGTNALHQPYQSTSAFPLPTDVRDRRDRAIHVIEADHAALFATLRDNGRLDDALVVITADHGETFGTDTGSPFLPRLADHGDSILRVPFLVRLPASTPNDLRSALAANTHRSIANMDIAPTLAALLGVRLADDLVWSGQDLTREVPEDRRVISVNVTEWRRFPTTALAVVREGEAFVCRSFDGCRLRRTPTSAGSAEPTTEDYRARFAEALEIPVVRENIAAIYRVLRADPGEPARP